MNLGSWLEKQRQEKKKGKLDGGQEKQLQDIGVVWDILSERWKNNYRLLVKFQQREGHCNVPHRHKEDEMNLGRWLGAQRQGKRKGKLDFGLEKQLEDIGVVWDVFSEQWEDNYRLLVRFQQQEGHCDVPQRHKEDEMNLGIWLDTQRKRRKKGTLDGSLQRRLEDIGVVWSFSL